MTVVAESRESSAEREPALANDTRLTRCAPWHPYDGLEVHRT
jgi:hypothetical protein